MSWRNEYRCYQWQSKWRRAILPMAQTSAIRSFIQNESNPDHSFILDISIAPRPVHYYSEAHPTQHGYCVGSLTPKRHRQLWVKKLPTWRLVRDSNPRPFGRQLSTLPMSHHVPRRRLLVLSWLQCAVSFCEASTVTLRRCLFLDLELNLAFSSVLFWLRACDLDLRDWDFFLL